MNEERFVVSDMLWRRLEPHLPGKISDAGATAMDNRLFWKRSCGECAPGRRGATSHLLLAVGTASSGGFEDGRKRAFSRFFSKT